MFHCSPKEVHKRGMSCGGFMINILFESSGSRNVMGETNRQDHGSGCQGSRRQRAHLI